MKLELVKSRIAQLRRESAPFIKKYNLTWNAVRDFNQKYSLDKRHTVYKRTFAGIPFISGHPLYEKIRSERGSSQILLDNGCGLGTNTRFTIYDGIPLKNVMGNDVDNRSIELGFKLFKDKEIMKNNFFVCDSKQLSRFFTSKYFTTVYSGFLFHHLKNEEGITKVLEESRKLLKPDGEHFGMTRGIYEPNLNVKFVKHVGKEYILTSKEKLCELLETTGYGRILVDDLIIDDEKRESVIFFYAKK